MALPRLNRQGVLEYSVPQEIISAAPEGNIYRHFAWFRRHEGDWMGEWAGYVPLPDISPRLRGDARADALEKWQTGLSRGISPIESAYATIDQEWHHARWNACPSGGAVCLDVTEFLWPVGDRRYHTYVEIAQLLDNWTAIRRSLSFKLGDDPDVLTISAAGVSTRPTRDAVPGKTVRDITDTPLEAVHEQLVGARVVRLRSGWVLEPAKMSSLGRLQGQKALDAARVDLDKIAIPKELFK